MTAASMRKAAQRAGLLAAFLLAALPGRTAWGQSPASPPPGQPTDLLEGASFALATDFGSLADFSEAFAVPFLASAPSSPTRGDGPGKSSPFDTAALARAAEDGNPGLAGSRSAISMAAADLASALAKRLPSINATFSATGIANPMDPITFAAGEFGTIDLSGLGGPVVPLPNKETVFLAAGDPFYYSAGASLTQPLFTWGKLKAGIDMASAGEEAALLAYDKARRELLLKIGASAESLAILGHLDAVLDLQATIGRRLIYISEESRKAGFITESDLIQARIDVKAVDLARAEITKRRELLLQDLRGLTGRADLSFADLAIKAPAAGKPRLSGKELADAARRGSVDLALVAALERVRAAGERLATGSRNLLPNLGLKLDISYAGSKIPYLEDGWEDKDDWTLNLSIAATASLFDGGAARAATKKAAAELEAARLQSEAAQAGIDALVRSAALDLDLARLHIEFDMLKIQGHRERVKDLRAESDAGSGSETAWLRALLDTLETVADGWSRLAEYRAALWRLEAALPPAGAELKQ